MENEKRCITGIMGFDKLCQGGLINESVNLILGNAGSGKTTFLLQFLYNGATKFNENGLFITFEQDPEDLYKGGLKQGMDFKTLEKQEKCFILKIDPESSIKQIEKLLLSKITKNDIQRICFDPINIFSMGFPKEINLRKQLYNFFSLLKQLKVCVLISGESDSESTDGNNKFEKEIIFCRYLSDSIIELFSSGIAGKGDRALRILKMRMTSHVRGPVGMQITSSGIKLEKF